MILAAFALTGAGTQASAQTAPEDVQAVDLGLPSGIRWASCNVGATTPEGYGYYFAWGETESKKDYSWTTYKYANVGERYHYKFTKYCTDASSGDNGFIDNKTVLEPEDDAATANWGDVWRMPTDAEWTELREQCTWTYTTLNGVYGYQVASKTNGNSIFLPVAGFRNGTSLYLQGTRGYYSSSSLLENYSDNIWIVTFNHEEVYRHSNNRNNGLSVRPVQDKQEEVVEPAYVAKPFTVAEGKQITFSGGNLQYTRSTGTWSFAKQQTDCLGDANITTDTNGNTVLADTIDLFGWGTGNNPADTSTNIHNYPTFNDWGTNVVGIDAAYTWRTLSKAEWKYLFCTRTDADQLFGFATVGSTEGLVILPDDWILPAGVAFTPSTAKGLTKSGCFYSNDNGDNYTHNVYTPADWLSMESAGAVFLPAAGSRYRTDINWVQSAGNYWSSTTSSDSLVSYLHFNNQYLIPDSYNRRSNAFSVRLVQDCVTFVPKPFTVAQGRQVTFSQGNLWHHIRKGVWRFAPHQYAYIGKANITYVSDEATLADSIDLFARSSNNPKTSFGLTVGWDYDCEDYLGDFLDWGTNVINGEPAGTWRTLSKSEWTYLFFSRTDADKLFGFTTVGDITGLVVLPDGWTTPQGVTFTPSTEHGLEYGRDGYYKADNYDFSTRNIYTPADWLKMEAAGAVFLPAAGYRTNVAVDNSTAYEGYYWSSSIREKHVYLMEFWLTPYREYASLWTIITGGSCGNGYSVRLVKDYSNVSTDAATPSAANTAIVRKVLRNGQILILRNGIYYDLHGRILNP